jgi:3-hydroxyacyl-CoA dehydrogenase
MSEVSEILERPKTEAPGNRKSASGKLMNVGFIGLGHMGAGMTANLLKAGHRVTVFNRTPAKAQALIADGATLSTSIAESWRRGRNHAGQRRGG